MTHFNYLLSTILTLCIFSSSCEYKEYESIADRKAKREAKRDLEILQESLSELKQEREKILELNKQSLIEIETYEEKRIAAERAEQIRIEADAIELKAIYNDRLKKIQQQQRFVWDGYIGRKYDTLTTSDGKNYTNCKVTSVDATGMSLQHQNGVSRIAFNLFGAEILKSSITDFEKQIKDLKSWLTIETNDRQFIRDKAKQDAEQKFK